MKIYDYIIEKIEKNGTLHMTLIDPDEYSPEEATRLSTLAEKHGSAAIMVGGSGVDLEATDACVKAIKTRVKLPVILFPGNVTGISKYADAIFYMSLLNSRSNYWLSLAQALGTYAVSKTNLEVIPMGYLIIESGKKTSVEFYGDANAIPKNKPKIAMAFSLAAQYMGMKLVYLEAGSGALEPVSNEMIQTVKKAINVPLIVGGGIRDGKTAYEKAKAGADIIVTGTIFEKCDNNEEKLKNILDGIKKAGKERR